MDVIVYRCRTDRLLFVPDCFLPSHEAVRRHGPLRRLGRLALDEGIGGLERRIAGGLESNAYAWLSASEAERLLGRNHPYLASHSRAQWTWRDRVRRGSPR